MNPREKAAVIFLSLAFLVGSMVSVVRHFKMKKQLQILCVEVESPPDSTKDRLVDINHARLEELDALPGIGPVLAQRIITYREMHGGFKTIAELRNVIGIGPKRFGAIKEFVTCRPLSADSSKHKNLFEKK